jgi:hypothetical protein
MIKNIIGNARQYALIWNSKLRSTDGRLCHSCFDKNEAELEVTRRPMPAVNSANIVTPPGQAPAGAQ